MPYYRLTLTINRIPIHSKYSSTRLTVFLFTPNPANLNDYKLLLTSFTEEQLGYDFSEWWFKMKMDMAIQEVNPSDAKGLGFYRAEVAYEDADGRTTETSKFDAHTKKFGEEIH